MKRIIFISYALIAAVVAATAQPKLSKDNIDEVMKAMTLEEKVAQLDILRGVEFTTLPHKIHNLAITYLQGMFNGRNYYRVRKGERLLSPEEQERVLNLLNRLGAQGPFEFDAYIEDYNW